MPFALPQPHVPIHRCAAGAVARVNALCTLLLVRTSRPSAAAQSKSGGGSSMKGKSALAEFCRDLCEDARNGRIDPVRRGPRAPCVAGVRPGPCCSSRCAGCHKAVNAGDRCPCGHMLAPR